MAEQRIPPSPPLEPEEAIPAPPVVPSLPDQCCARCRFFMAAPTPQLPVFCRRFPPTPFIINLNWNEDKTQIVGNQQISTQPTVHPAGWCGEFIRRPEDVQ
jgi:hypothetical protein